MKARLGKNATGMYSTYNERKSVATEKLLQP